MLEYTKYIVYFHYYMTQMTHLSIFNKYTSFFTFFISLLNYSNLHMNIWQHTIIISLSFCLWDFSASLTYLLCCLVGQWTGHLACNKSDLVIPSDIPMGVEKRKKVNSHRMTNSLNENSCSVDWSTTPSSSSSSTSASPASISSITCISTSLLSSAAHHTL